MCKEKKDIIICSNCNSTSIFIDYNIGEIVCTNCGLVQNKCIGWKNEVYDK
jgi:transcription initiation factor TFIIIB Brf1 subunit/transcription initiation factor TFIIB